MELSWESPAISLDERSKRYAWDRIETDVACKYITKLCETHTVVAIDSRDSRSTAREHLMFVHERITGMSGFGTIAVLGGSYRMHIETETKKRENNIRTK